VGEQKQQITPSSDGHKIVPVPKQKQQITLDVSGHEITDTDSGDLPSEQTKEDGSGDLPIHPLNERDIPTNKGLPQPQQPTVPQDSTAKVSAQQQDHLRILIDWDKLSDKMAELPKDIKNFWLCGRIDNGNLFDMALEREQPQIEVIA
jgi:hypothetical protein